jgi:hypothetical protein
VADDWVFLIDHSVQIGTVKVCVILGLRLRDVPYRTAIEKWSCWEATVRQSVEYVRTCGLSCDCEQELSSRLRALPPHERADALVAELVEFTRQQSQAARPGERLVGSTEVLESVFGKWQTLERQESRSGITSLVLSLAAC